jgi:hypothetical protein
MAADLIDGWIARQLRRIADIFDRPTLPVTLPPVLLPADASMIYRRWKAVLSAADFARGTWVLTVTVQGQPSFTMPLTADSTFRTLADLPFTAVQQLTDNAGLVYLPSLPVTTPAHPRTPDVCLKFLGFEEIAGPLSFAAVGSDNPLFPFVR